MLFRPSSLPLVAEWRKVIREQPKTRWDQVGTRSARRSHATAMRRLA